VHDGDPGALFEPELEDGWFGTGGEEHSERHRVLFLARLLDQIGLLLLERAPKLVGDFLLR
jgi:hypothetical protein